MLQNSNWTFIMSTKIVSGVNVIDAVGEELSLSGIKSILVVTDEAMMETEVIARVIKSLKTANINNVIFPQVQPDPTVKCAEDAYKVLSGNNCEAVIGVGGGSAIDVAKATAILATNPGPISQYEGANKIPTPPLPIYAVPTTAGTGSEVSQSSILADGPLKKSIRSIWAAPKAAFLDPTVVSTVPLKVAISSGLDALAHNLEAYVSRWASPMTECLNEKGLRLIGESIRQYLGNPENFEAASKMQLAAMLGAAAFANCRVGTPHALGMALGGAVHIAHGLGCGLALAPCIEFSWVANPIKYRKIAEFLGVRIEELSDVSAVKALIRYIVELEESFGVAPDLRSYGVTEEHIDILAEDMIRGGQQLTDPRSLSLEDAKAIVRRALDYKL